MIFLNFSHFPENQAKFSLTGKCFLLTNFFNGKQTQESLENNFLKITFQKTNTVLYEENKWRPSKILINFFLTIIIPRTVFPTKIHG